MNEIFETAPKRLRPVEVAQTKFAKYVRSLDYNSIGNNVYAERVTGRTLSDITAICRRRFKSKDVIVFVDLTPDDDYDAGIVFTEDKLFSWTDAGLIVNEITYDSITKVDFDEEDLIIECDEKTTRINLGDDAEEEKYPRAMYSFLMDILDYSPDGSGTIEE